MSDTISPSSAAFDINCPHLQNARIVVGQRLHTVFEFLGRLPESTHLPEKVVFFSWVHVLNSFQVLRFTYISSVKMADCSGSPTLFLGCIVDVRHCS